jgi:hypothetical protein
MITPEEFAKAKEARLEADRLQRLAEILKDADNIMIALEKMLQRGNTELCIGWLFSHEVRELVRARCAASGWQEVGDDRWIRLVPLLSPQPELTSPSLWRRLRDGISAK